MGPAIDVVKSATAAYQRFMDILGIPADENSRETAARVAKMMFKERTKALHSDPPELKVFPADDYDEYIAVKDIPYYSTCAHHHVTFYGHASIAYWPEKVVVGLSKIARVVKYFAAKPQIQEGLTNEIAQYLYLSLHPKGLMVKLTGRHLCMESRGVQSTGMTVTQKLLGYIDKSEAMELFR